MLVCGLCAACQPAEEPLLFVARVGDAYLMQDELDAALDNLPPDLDSMDARRQLIDQWVANELLFQEAKRLDLRAREGVKRQLEEGERAVLIDALVTELFGNATDVLLPGEVASYYEQHKEQLRLLEPFVRVRYLHRSNQDSVRRARDLLRSVPALMADSVFAVLAIRFSEDPVMSLSLLNNYLPESRLLVEQPAVREQMARLAPKGQVRIIESEDSYHLLQIADRAPAGAVPELLWVEGQVRRQLTIDSRKQMYERLVQRLRTEALSREALVIK